jgi:methionyl aminopeptidase
MRKIPLKTARDIDTMRGSSRIVAEVLSLIGERVKPGVTTQELDEFAEEYIRLQGGEPAFKGYGHDRNNLFPATLCVSLDDEVVHGIPAGRRLKEGQVVSVDVGVKKDGFFGDGAKTFAVGRISEEKLRLLRVTEEALYKGIAKALAGNHLHDVSAAVQEHVEAAGFSVVRDLVGHGIGRSLHEEPAVPNYGARGTGILLEAGMVLAIEPMVNAGTYRVQIESDGWTVRTADGKPSAHFEHTVVVRKGEAEILTRHG